MPADPTAHDPEKAAPSREGAPAQDICLRLRLARESYLEVLDATKHQDDKVGRFLTGMAFLVAGALAFTGPDVLRVRYVMGTAGIHLPAILLGSFIALIGLAALFYLLATSAPLTLPQRGGRRSGESHLFFGLIARDTESQWRERWESDADNLTRSIYGEYLAETLNLARRADSKARTSRVGSALFVVALLLFVLTMVVVVDANTSPMSDPTSREWSLPLRGAGALILTAFTLTLLYQRLLRISRDIAGYVLRARGFHQIAFGSVVAIVVISVPSGLEGPGPAVLAGAGLLAGAAIVIDGYSKVLRRHEPDASKRERLERTAVAVAAGVLVVGGMAGLLLRHGAWQLLVAMLVALSPLAGTPVGTVARARRARKAAEEDGSPDEQQTEERR